MFCCRGKRMANYLLDHNCKLLRIDTDNQSRGFLVFIFKRNTELNNALILWEKDKSTYLVSLYEGEVTNGKYGNNKRDNQLRQY